MSISSVSAPAASVPAQPVRAATPPPPATKVDSDGDHDGTKAGASTRLLDVKA